MRAVIQRVSEARVVVSGEVIGEIGRGLVVFVGVEQWDLWDDAAYIAEKTARLRIFGDEAGKFNVDVMEVGGAVLVISQFTLHGDCRRGRRPSFMAAARPEWAVPLYERVVALLRERGIPVATGSFGADMRVELVNEGPVTILLDSRKNF